MPRATPIQTSFNAGELSPRVFGRVDLQRYASAVETMENLICTVQGPAFRRSGTRHVVEAIDSTKRSRLLPFVVTDDQAFVLEMAEGKIRILAAESLVLASAKTFTTIDNNDEIPLVDFSYSDEQGPFRLTTTGTLPTGLATNTNYYIVRIDSNDAFSLATGPGGPAVSITSGTGTGTHTISPFVPLAQEIDVPYAESELFAVQMAQQAQVAYFVHKDVPPSKLTLKGAGKWRWEEIEFYDGPYEGPPAEYKRVGSFMGTSGSDTRLIAAYFNRFLGTYSTGNGDFDHPFSIWRPEDVGRHVRVLNTDGNWGFGIVHTVLDGKEARAAVPFNRPIEDFTTPGTDDYRLGAFRSGNYPSCVSFHEQRLILAADPLHPNRFYGSVIGDYENFAPSGGPNRVEVASFDAVISQSNGYSFAVASDRVNSIVWINSIRNMIIGTVGGIWPVQASSQLEAISATNINTRRSSVRGAAPVQPVNADDATIYVSRDRRRLLAVFYSFETDSFIPTDLMALADHIGDEEIVEIAYAGDPDPIVWGVRSDGQLLGFTFDRNQAVAGWHRHLLGGTFQGGPAQVESITVIPATEGSISTGASPNPKHDQLWMVVRRTINGVDVRHIEFMEERFLNASDQDDAYFVDAGLSYDGAPTSTLSGLGHLEGEEVMLLADGASIPNATVSGGQVTLQQEASRVHAGLPYTSVLKTLRLEAAGSRQGSSQGKLKRINEVLLRFDRTIGAEIAREGGWDPILFRTTADLMGAPPPFFSGDKVQQVDVGWELEGQVTLRQVQPFPFHLLAVGFRSDSAERGVER